MDSIGFRTLVVSCSLVVLANFGCARGLVKTEMGLADAAQTVGIVAYSTEYKNQIAQKLAERFQGRAKVTLHSIGDLKAIDCADYDALVIIDQLMAWQLFNIDSGWFLRRIEDPQVRRKIVLYLTAGSPKADYRFQGIDAITGATAIGREDEAIDAIAARVEAILGTP